ncbi:uncharacterized protein LOC111103624 [Crassostrea virginica]
MIENNQSSTYIKPVDIMLDYLRVRPSVQANLFCHFGDQALTRVQFTTVLGKALKAFGVDSTRYKSHSFRIGAATNAAMLGISDEDICKAEFHVWVVGSSIVKRAFVAARNRPGGVCLGLQRLGINKSGYGMVRYV